VQGRWLSDELRHGGRRTGSGSQTINQDGFEAQQKVFQQQEKQQSKADEKRKVEPVRVWTLDGGGGGQRGEGQGIWREALPAHGLSTKHTGRSGSHLSTARNTDHRSFRDAT
jgi:hypothetical protein